MSHFLTLVLTDTGEHDEVERLLAPYAEDGEWFSDGSRWDWWTIGGRWTGFLDSSYDPETDPRNIETCWLCSGTGTRTDMDCSWCGGCNGCRGEGKSVKWPTDWAEVDSNVRPVAEIQPDTWPHPPLALVTPDGKWHERTRMGWFGIEIKNEDGEDRKPEEVWAAVVRALLEQHPDATVVVVDCHV